MCCAPVGSGKKRVVFAGMLGGVLEPGGDTICVAAGLAPLPTPRVVGLPGSLLLFDMVPEEWARKGLREGASNGGRTQRSVEVERANATGLKCRTASWRAAMSKSNANEGLSGQL